jgi:hypothetical protein
MLLDLNTIETIGQADLEDLQSKLLYRKFGQENDSIELTIRDINGNIVINDEQFTDYTAYYSGGGQGNLVDSIDIDYIQVLKDYGFENGKYKLIFSFQRKLLVNTFERPFYISEISPSRTEIRFASSILAEDAFNNALQNLIANVNNASFVKDVNISFSSGETGLVVNTQIDTDSGLIKLYDPLTTNISVNSSFRIYEEIINPLEATIDLGPSTSEDIGVELRAPNFDIQFSQEYTVPSKFRTYDDILNQGAVTSSFQNIQNYFSGSIPIDLEFDNPNTPSGYTFENFIHFSSATERLKNFKYKLELLESYSSSLATLGNITGSISESSPTTQNINIFRNKRDKLIGGFDYYERYLYYESGTYAWPKINIGKPYTNAKVNSTAATSWFGAPIDDDQNEFYGGQMLSASKFDSYNPYNLVNTIPPDIQNNPQNEGYILFTEMIAQHFDGIWAYIDSITDKPQAYSGLNDGISKELVFNALTEKGIRGYSQFENSSIYEYLIGDDGNGTFQYQSPNTFSTMVSASNAGSIPKGDISKEIWKRLYHNTPYLLKTKGTKRGLKALIACYGIPETVLHVKEFGGPLVDKTGFRTFSYQKESRMVDVGSNGTYRGLVQINNAITDPTPAESIKTAQIRVIPSASSEVPIFAIHNENSNDNSFALFVSKSNNELVEPNVSASFGKLVVCTGSLSDSISSTTVITSSLIPLFNGKPWNFSLTWDSGSSNQINIYATQTSFNKNTFLQKLTLTAENVFQETNHNLYYIPMDNDNDGIFGITNANLYRNSRAQEARAYTEILTENTIVTQSLSPFNYNGNTISSSYDTLKFRFPLGSDIEDIDEDTVIINAHSNPKYNKIPNIDGFTYTSNGATLRIAKTYSIEETHHLTTPDTVGSGMVSDKVRIDNGTFDDNFLDPFISVETSPQDRQPLDFSDVGVFFSPTFEVNEDIIYTLGGFRLDDYIGDPTYYTSASYPALKDLKDIYTQKLDKKLGIGDYIRTIQFFDHTLFKMIKDFVPAKANLKTGLVIEPHYLERVKVPGKNVDYEQKPEHLFHVQSSASLVGSENINETNIVIDVEEYLTQGTEGTATENVAQVGKKSKFYILR